jgi:HEAT repeat protein
MRPLIRWLVCVALILSIVRTASVQEPTLEAKPLGAWVKQLETGDVSGRLAAARAALGDGFPGERRGAGTGKALEDADVLVRSEAAGTRPDRSRRGTGVPLLMSALKDRERLVCTRAAFALGQVGPAAVPVLADGLTDKDMKVRKSCLFALSLSGTVAKEAVPALIKAIEDKQSGIGPQAFDVLIRLGPEAKAAIPALVAVAKQRTTPCGVTPSSVRRWARQRRTQCLRCWRSPAKKGRTISQPSRFSRKP